jgi:signal transduction histidine kinase
LVRFNESMDEALAASLLYFAAEAARMRNLFLGILSHELRTPLSTIMIAQSKQTQLDGQAVLAEFLAAATRSVAATATQVEQVKATVLRIEARSARPATV